MLRPNVFYTVKQPLGSKLCGACVAAMAVGRKDIDEEITLTLHDGMPYVRTRHLLEYIGRHGILCGLLLTNRGEVDADMSIDLTWQPFEFPAILVVESQTFKDGKHLIFWDGNNIRDPNPKEPETSDLSEYVVLDIMPLTYIDESKEP